MPADVSEEYPFAAELLFSEITGDGEESSMENNEKKEVTGFILRSFRHLHQDHQKSQLPKETKRHLAVSLRGDSAGHL